MAARSAVTTVQHSENTPRPQICQAFVYAKNNVTRCFDADSDHPWLYLILP